MNSILLPPLGGNAREWGTWWELHHIYVHKNQLLDDTQEFAHPKLALKGNAKKSLEGLETKGANYSIAIGELSRSYANTNQTPRTLLWRSEQVLN